VPKYLAAQKYETRSVALNSNNILFFPCPPHERVRAEDPPSPAAATHTPHQPPYRSGPSRDWLKIKNPDSPSDLSAALRAQFNRAFAPPPSLGRPISELSFTGVNGAIEMERKAERAQGYRKEAEKYAKLAKSGQSDNTNVHRTIAERYAWMAENLERRENLTHTLVRLLGKHE
jgi:hypothetical protein